MARVKLNFSIVLVIALVVSYGITSTEERQLRMQVRAAGMEKGTGNLYFGRSLLVDNDGDSDDFRPTNPGHSPGAGHSTGPSSKNAH
ncbi:conserved hypothetical protein [Ricinus communis]|uniref:Uncharacterized protein n=1 Tax=Ricinus communis TaxID=3988 RepID=B9R7H2_RICCO|nr:conserved hypothetical protein [Ricinus communis]